MLRPALVTHFPQIQSYKELSQSIIFAFHSVISLRNVVLLWFRASFRGFRVQDLRFRGFRVLDSWKDKILKNPTILSDMQSRGFIIIVWLVENFHFAVVWYKLPDIFINWYYRRPLTPPTPPNIFLISPTIWYLHYCFQTDILYMEKINQFVYFILWKGQKPISPHFKHSSKAIRFEFAILDFSFDLEHILLHYRTPISLTLYLIPPLLTLPILPVLWNLEAG